MSAQVFFPLMGISDTFPHRVPDVTAGTQTATAAFSKNVFAPGGRPSGSARIHRTGPRPGPCPADAAEGSRPFSSAANVLRCFPVIKTSFTATGESHTGIRMLRETDRRRDGHLAKSCTFVLANKEFIIELDGQVRQTPSPDFSYSGWRILVRARRGHEPRVQRARLCVPEVWGHDPLCFAKRSCPRVARGLSRGMTNPD